MDTHSEKREKVKKITECTCNQQQEEKGGKPKEPKKQKKDNKKNILSNKTGGKNLISDKKKRVRSRACALTLERTARSRSPINRLAQKQGIFFYFLQVTYIFNQDTYTLRKKEKGEKNN